MEKLKLKNGNEYTLIVNGINKTDTNIVFQVNAEKTLAECQADFEDVDAVSEITLLDEVGSAIQTPYTLYTELDSIALHKNVVIGRNNIGTNEEPVYEDIISNIFIITLLRQDEVVAKLEEIESRITEITNSAAEPTIDDMEFEEYRAYRIKKSKEALAAYLAANPLTSTAHNEAEGIYAITEEKQTLMMSNLMSYQLAVQAGVPDVILTWNESGKACEVWTLEEFTQLVLEVQAFVKPLISQQQHYEEAIMECETKEDISAITFNYGE